MKVKTDTTGCDNLTKEYEDAYFNALIEIGRKCIQKQKGSHDYKNRTGNLEGATGFCVVRNGMVVHVETIDGRNSKTAEHLLSNATHDGLWFGNGMGYASYVQSKGFDVQDTAIMEAMREING